MTRNVIKRNNQIGTLCLTLWLVAFVMIAMMES